MKNLAMSSLALAALLTACTTVGRIPASRLATVDLRSAAGTPAGTAILTAAGDRVTIAVTASGLPEGVHGVHLHTIGSCDAPAFATAGGHLNPAGHQHGTSNPAGSHLGDLPNLVVGKNGVGTLTADLRASRAEVEAALFDADGTALVIHAGPDDYRTDPSGNSGSRIACGVLNRSGS